MYSKFHFLPLFRSLLTLTKITPCTNAPLATLFPLSQVIKFNFVLGSLLSNLVCALSLVCRIHAREVVAFFFDFPKELLASTLYFGTKRVAGEVLEPLRCPSQVFFPTQGLYTVSRLTHYPLVRSTPLRIHKRLVSLLKCMKGICRAFVPALVGMHEDGESTKLFFNLNVVCLLRQLEHIEWI